MPKPRGQQGWATAGTGGPTGGGLAEPREGRAEAGGRAGGTEDGGRKTGDGGGAAPWAAALPAGVPGSGSHLHLALTFGPLPQELSTHWSTVRPSARSWVRSFIRQASTSPAPPPRTSSHGPGRQRRGPGAGGRLGAAGRHADCCAALSPTKRQPRWLSIWSGTGQPTAGHPAGEAPPSPRMGSWGGRCPPLFWGVWRQRSGLTFCTGEAWPDVAKEKTTSGRAR